MNSRTGLLALIFIVLPACNHSGGSSSDILDSTNILDPIISSKTPELLRNIPTADLSAKITIGTKTTTHSGKDSPDGNWSIPIDLEPSQQYTIFVEWYLSDILLMEEKGRFETDPATPSINPKMSFITSGFPRFDNDCDGVSNLEEIRSNNDPLTAQGTNQNLCIQGPLVPPDLAAIAYPWVTQTFRHFETIELIDGLTHFAQPIQVMSVDVNLASVYGGTLYSTKVNDVEDTALIELVFVPSTGKQVRVVATNATAAKISTIEGASCDPLEPAGIECWIPYEWKEQHWYQFEFQKISDTNWTTFIFDQEANQREALVEIEYASPKTWRNSVVGLGYREDFTALDCTRGIPPITIQLRVGIVNNEFQVGGEPKPTPSDCVNYGAGWNKSDGRTIDGETVYSLTLGLL